MSNAEWYTIAVFAAAAVLFVALRLVFRRERGIRTRLVFRGAAVVLMIVAFGNFLSHVVTGAGVGAIIVGAIALVILIGTVVLIVQSSVAEWRLSRAASAHQE